MRNLFLISAIAAMSSCSTTPAEQASQSARAETELQKHLAGKVAGKAQECLPTFRTSDMIRIDDDTVLFRDGANRIYRNELTGSCNGLGSPNYTLVTHSIGGSGQLCRGDIARMVNMASGVPVGSCVIGQFVPYTTPRG